MKEQILELKNVKSFNLTHIFECGQCFRWNRNDDGSYTGIVGQNVIQVAMPKDNIVIAKSYGKDDLNSLFNTYFNMNVNYEAIKDRLCSIDEYLKQSVEYGSGMRILNQDLWETIISFIISANNNIPRIKGIIERISKRYGNKITWDNADYYTFPTPKQLSKASVEDLRNLGLGFRDVRVFETTKIVNENKINFKKIHEEPNTNIVREQLLTLPGVGPKVADCILLFSSLQRLDVFPIDVWVRRVMNDLYIKNSDESKVSKKQIKDLADRKFGNIQGIAQQYLFYWRREKQ